MCFLDLLHLAVANAMLYLYRAFAECMPFLFQSKHHTGKHLFRLARYTRNAKGKNTKAKIYFEPFAYSSQIKAQYYAK